jgi:hypothetical protein
LHQWRGVEVHASLNRLLPEERSWQSLVTLI